MPNRVLRDWTKSFNINKLSEGAEVFFTRLIMKADDYGGYYGNAELLCSALFPLRPKNLKRVAGWLKECVTAGIVRKYEVDGKIFLLIKDFDQRLRIKRRKFPEPEEVKPTGRPHVGQMSDTRPSHVGLKPKPKPETEVETESESEGANAQTHRVRAREAPVAFDEKKPESEAEEKKSLEKVLLWPDFSDFWLTYGKKVDEKKCLELWKNITQAAREKIMQHLPGYVSATPDLRYRRDPANYLKNKTWENDTFGNNQTNGGPTGRITKEGTMRRFANYRKRSGKP